MKRFYDGMKSLGAPSLKPGLSRERCSRVRFSGARCERCLAGCPTDSIRITYPALTIDDTCSGCGFCVALCPNEVFSFPGESPMRLTTDDEKPGPLYCSGLLAAGPMAAAVLPPSVVPCLGSVSTAFVLARVLRDGQPVEVVTGSCGECPMRAGERGYRLREREMESLFDYLGIGFSPARVSPGSAAERQEVSRQCAAFQAGVEASKALSRRAFLRHLGASAVTGRSQPERNDARPGDVGPGHRGPFGERRSLVEIFRRYGGSVAGRRDAVPGFTEIRVDEHCTGCGACTGVCPTGALSVDEGPAAVQLKWTPAHCSHCNLCFDVCSRKALHWLPCLDAARIAREIASTIKVFQRHLCEECGNIFLSSGSGACCSACSKTENLREALSMMIYGEERRTAS